MPPRQNRITRGDDYRRISRAGRRVGGAVCTTHAVLRSSGEPARFGFIISRAVGNAVTRNLVRRRMKTVVERRLHAGISGWDIVFRASPAAGRATFDELQAEMTRALDRVERWEHSPRAGGTT